MLALIFELKAEYTDLLYSVVCCLIIVHKLQKGFRLIFVFEKFQKTTYIFNGKYVQPIRDEYLEESISALSSAIAAKKPLSRILICFICVVAETSVKL